MHISNNYTYPNTEIISYRNIEPMEKYGKDNAGRWGLPGVSAEIIQDGGQVPEDESNIFACRTSC